MRCDSWGTRGPHEPTMPGVERQEAPWSSQEVIPAFWATQLARAGELIFLSFYNEKVLILGWGSKGNTIIREAENHARHPRSPSLSALPLAPHGDLGVWPPFSFPFPWAITPIWLWFLTQPRVKALICSSVFTWPISGPWPAEHCAPALFRSLQTQIMTIIEGHTGAN